MKRKAHNILTVLIILLSVVSCNINKQIMFKAPLGEFAPLDSLTIQSSENYRIGVNDKISFSLSTNNGVRMLEQISDVKSENEKSQFSNEFTVRKDSTIELPVLGKVFCVGMTVEEFENHLEELFSRTYKKPFVRARVTNKRVIVFPGDGASARVVYLTNENTTLMEALGETGGIQSRGDASQVKLMRMENGQRKIYNIDLSTIDGLKYADVVLQANDFVYVNPTPDLAKGFTQEIAPIMTVVSSAIVLITVFLTLK